LPQREVHPGFSDFESPCSADPGIEACVIATPPAAAAFELAFRARLKAGKHLAA